MFVTIGQLSPTPKSVKNARNVPYFDRFWRGWRLTDCDEHLVQYSSVGKSQPKINSIYENLIWGPSLFGCIVVGIGYHWSNVPSILGVKATILSERHPDLSKRWEASSRRMSSTSRRTISRFESSMPSKMILKATPHYNVRRSKPPLSTSTLWRMIWETGMLVWTFTYCIVATSLDNRSANIFELSAVQPSSSRYGTRTTSKVLFLSSMWRKNRTLNTPESWPPRQPET